MAMQPVDACLFVFFLISLPIYILFITTIILNRSESPFNGSFFTLCLALGFFDLAYIIHSYAFDKAANFGWFQPFFYDNGYVNSIFPMYVTMLVWGFTLGQFLVTLLIAINRYTAIVHSLRHEKLWTSRRLTIAFVLVAAGVIIFMAPLTTMQFGYFPMFTENGSVDGDCVNLNFANVDQQTIYYGVACILAFLITALTCIFYILTIVRLIQRHRKNVKTQLAPKSSTKTVSINTLIPPETVDKSAVAAVLVNKLSSNVNSDQLRLMLCGFAMFIAMAIYFCFVIVVAISDTTINRPYFILYKICSHLFSLLNPYALLIMSRTTRRHFLLLLRCKFGSNVAN